MRYPPGRASELRSRNQRLAESEAARRRLRPPPPRGAAAAPRPQARLSPVGDAGRAGGRDAGLQPRSQRGGHPALPLGVLERRARLFRARAAARRRRPRKQHVAAAAAAQTGPRRRAYLLLPALRAAAASSSGLLCRSAVRTIASTPADGAFPRGSYAEESHPAPRARASTPASLPSATHRRPRSPQPRSRSFPGSTAPPAAGASPDPAGQSRGLPSVPLSPGRESCSACLRSLAGRRRFSLARSPLSAGAACAPWAIPRLPFLEGSGAPGPGRGALGG